MGPEIMRFFIMMCQQWHVTNNVPAFVPVHHKNSKDNQDKVTVNSHLVNNRKRLFTAGVYLTGADT